MITEQEDGEKGVPSQRSEPSQNVVSVVAAAEDVDPVALEPLYSVVDPDALDAVLAADASSDVKVAFEYAGYQVTVTPESVTIDADEA